MMQYGEEDLSPWAYGDPPMDGVWQRQFPSCIRYAKLCNGLWYLSRESPELAASEQCEGLQSVPFVKYTVPWRGLKNKP